MASNIGIEVRVDDREIRRALQRLVDAGQDLRPAFREIGEYLDLATRERFDRAQAPDGTRWAPLKPRTLKRKQRRKRPLDILVDSGDLRDLMRYHVTADRLEFGTDRKYGATHQFGDPRRNIPARPFLGLSDDDRREVLDILQEHLRIALRP